MLFEARKVVIERQDTSWQAHVRADMLHYLMVWIRTLDEADMFLTHEEAVRAQDAGRANLLCYQALAEDAAAANKSLWKLRPKMHYVAHTIEMLTETYENPATLDLFSWEDFVGKVKRVAAKTHRATASLRVVQRWMLLLTTRWHRRRHKTS